MYKQRGFKILTIRIFVWRCSFVNFPLLARCNFLRFSKQLKHLFSFVIHKYIQLIWSTYISKCNVQSTLSIQKPQFFCFPQQTYQFSGCRWQVIPLCPHRHKSHSPGTQCWAQDLEATQRDSFLVCVHWRY